MSQSPCPCPALSARDVRPEARAFAHYVPGLTIAEIKERYQLSDVIKLASNENPLGASPLVQQAMRDHAGLVFRYPQSGVPRLQAAMARRFGLDAACVVPGSGSNGIIDLLVRVKAVPGLHNIVAFKPCFSVYELQARLCGVEFRQTPLRPDFSFPWDDLLALMDENTAIAFVTTPDNPTGYCPPVAELEDLARRIPPYCLLVIDEAYMDFCDNEAAHSLLPRLMDFPNVAVLRTFSKSYGLAGLRLGCGLMHPELAAVLRTVSIPFAVSLMAEEAGLAALKDDAFYRETLRVSRAGRVWLNRELKALNCEVWPSQANFLLVKTPRPGNEVFEALLRKGVIVRPLASGYNLPDHLRISIGTAEENAALVKALREIL